MGRLIINGWPAFASMNVFIADHPMMSEPSLAFLRLQRWLKRANDLVRYAIRWTEVQNPP